MSTPFITKVQAPVRAEPLIPAQGNGRRLQKRLSPILQSVAAILQDNVASGSHTNGTRVAALEMAFKQRLGVADVCGVSSGSAALRAACELLHLPPGSEVIVPAYTFIMSAYAVSDAFAFDEETGAFSKLGLVPVFVDVDPCTYTLDPHKARKAITDKTRAMVVVHMLGQMAAMRPLLDLAQEYDLFVIEDAAQAVGATYLDPVTDTVWQAGSVGHFGCFSLSAVKNVGSMGSDAGALTITQRLLDRLPDAAEHVRAWRNTGRLSRHRYHHQTWGLRARMDEYAAAECFAELDSLEQWNEQRRMIAARYTAALFGSRLQPPSVAPECEHVFFNYLVKAPDLEARKELEQRLHDAGIQVADTYTCVADQDLYRKACLSCRIMPLEISRELADLLVAIPCYPELSEREIERIEAVLSTSKTVSP